MLDEWYLIKPQPTINSGFEEDEFTDYAQDGFDELLTETQLGKDIVFCKGDFDGKNFEIEVNGKGIVQSETPDTYTQGNKRQLLTRIGEIDSYKYIKYDSKIWLIMTEPSNNCIYEKCVLHQCNYTLKWQNSNKKIIYCPAVIENASQYNTGEEKDRSGVITLGYNQLMVYVSTDENTVAIDRTLRLFIDYNKKNPLVYRVTRIDTVTYSYAENRVMCFVATEEQYNSTTDSIENWLCDYFQNSPIIIKYSGNPTIRVGGTKTLIVDTDDNVLWSISSDVKATILPNGNSVKVSCPNDLNNIGKIVVVIAEINGVVGKCELTISGGV